MVNFLIVRAPDGSSNKVPLSGKSIGVGRATTNYLAFPEDSGLSRNHLLFEEINGEWTVRDLGSKNGTMVNNSRLAAVHRLAAGDRVTAGHLVIEFGDAAARLAETVVFVPDRVTSTPSTATVVTNLEGALAGKMAAATGGSVASVQTSLAGDRHVKALVRAGRELAGHRPLNELFEVILDLAVDGVNASRGVLMTVEKSGLTVRAARGEGFRISAAVRDRVLEEKASLLVRDVEMDDAFRDRLSIVEHKVRSIMAVPLQTNQQVLGLIYLDISELGREFLPEDLGLLTVMANVAAIRIEHARLAEVEAAEQAHAREMQQAAEIQRQLLPAGAPSVDGLDIAGYNAPCLTVGGDYFQFQEQRDGRMVIMVGDVAGKGMSAALLMSHLQATIQVLLEDLADAGSMVTRLNSLIASRCPGNRFITFFVGVFSPSREEIVYCNAGHNPPLVIRADGRVETLKGGGIILGVLPKAKYEEYRCELDRGDTVVLFSDGVTEASRPETMEEFGEEKLGALLSGMRTQSAEMMVDAVKEAVAAWSAGAPPFDDITLVIARRT